MGWLKCRLGRHAWEKKRNPEMSGALAEYNVCSRCRKEQDVYGIAPPTGW